MSNSAFFRLQQLISPSLPIGAFTYSQGMEWAVECGWIKDAVEDSEELARAGFRQEPPIDCAEYKLGLRWEFHSIGTDEGAA